jgi:long-chain acyl-CoA synthetase
MPKNLCSFSYLPILHVAKREAVEIHGMYPGVTVSFPESLETFAADLAAAKP